MEYIMNYVPTDRFCDEITTLGTYTRWVEKRKDLPKILFISDEAKLDLRYLRLIAENSERLSFASIPYRKELFKFRHAFLLKYLPSEYRQMISNAKSPNELPLMIHLARPDFSFIDVLQPSKISDDELSLHLTKYVAFKKSNLGIYATAAKTMRTLTLEMQAPPENLCYDQDTKFCIIYAKDPRNKVDHSDKIQEIFNQFSNDNMRLYKIDALLQRDFLYAFGVSEKEALIAYRPKRSKFLLAKSMGEEDIKSLFEKIQTGTSILNEGQLLYTHPNKPLLMITG